MFTIIGGDGREYGPASAEQIRGWITAGRANLETKAKAVGTEDWRRLGDFPEFAGPGGTPPVIGEATSNPTASATAPVADAPVTPGLQLADRLVRLGAWFIDNVIAFLLMLPGAIVLGASVILSLLRNQGDFSGIDMGRLLLGSLLLGVGGLVLLIVQVWLLTTRGQTIGKRILGIRIVGYLDNENAGFVRAVLLRAVVPGIVSFVLGFLPPLGFIFFLVDSCFIFRADQRCVHDLIAGTKVVKA